MIDDIMVPFQQEGEQPEIELDKENEDSSSSPEVKEDKDDTDHTEDEKKETKTEDPKSSEGDDNTPDDPDKDKPFHEHPRWKDRETDWNKRFNDQETRHQDDLTNLRSEFGNARKEITKDKEIPEWFAGDQDLWNKFRKDQKEELTAVKEEIVANVEAKEEARKKGIKEATDYIKSEVSFIEGDKKLNPEGLKVDQNKLYKVVLDNNIIDTDGRWNYRAGWLILKSQTKGKEKDTTNKDRKVVAGALNSDNKPEKKQVPYKTNKDFEMNPQW